MGRHRFAFPVVPKGGGKPWAVEVTALAGKNPSEEWFRHDDKGRSTLGLRRVEQLISVYTNEDHQWVWRLDPDKEPPSQYSCHLAALLAAACEAWSIGSLSSDAGELIWATGRISKEFKLEPVEQDQFLKKVEAFLDAGEPAQLLICPADNQRRLPKRRRKSTTTLSLSQFRSVAEDADYWLNKDKVILRLGRDEVRNALCAILRPNGRGHPFLRKAVIALTVLVVALVGYGLVARHLGHDQKKGGPQTVEVKGKDTPKRQPAKVSSQCPVAVAALEQGVTASIAKALKLLSVEPDKKAQRACLLGILKGPNTDAITTVFAIRGLDSLGFSGDFDVAMHGFSRMTRNFLDRISSMDKGKIPGKTPDDVYRVFEEADGLFAELPDPLHIKGGTDIDLAACDGAWELLSIGTRPKDFTIPKSKRGKVAGGVGGKALVRWLAACAGSRYLRGRFLESDVKRSGPAWKENQDNCQVFERCTVIPTWINGAERRCLCSEKIPVGSCASHEFVADHYEGGGSAPRIGRLKLHPDCTWPKGPGFLVWKGNFGVAPILGVGGVILVGGPRANIRHDERDAVFYPSGPAALAESDLLLPIGEENVAILSKGMVAAATVKKQDGVYNLQVGPKSEVSAGRVFRFWHFGPSEIRSAGVTVVLPDTVPGDEGFSLRAAVPMHCDGLKPEEGDVGISFFVDGLPMVCRGKSIDDGDYCPGKVLSAIESLLYCEEMYRKEPNLVNAYSGMIVRITQEVCIDRATPHPDCATIFDKYPESIAKVDKYILHVQPRATGD